MLPVPAEAGCLLKSRLLSQRAPFTLPACVLRKSSRFEKNNIATTIRHAAVYRGASVDPGEFRKNPEREDSDELLGR